MTSRVLTIRHWLASGVVKKIFLLIFIPVFFGVTIILNLLPLNNHQFSLMAKAFLQGRADIELIEPYADDIDTALYNGKYYFILSPFPAILLLPFSLISNLLGIFLFHGYIHIFLVMLVFVSAYKLAYRFGYSKVDSLWLSFSFCFASTYVGSAYNPMSWYFSHTVAVLGLLLAFYEYYTKKRYWMIGFYLACVLATRVTAGIAVLFFVLVVVFGGSTVLSKVKSLGLLLFPVLVSGLLLLHYNMVRFNSYFDNGYTRSRVHIVDNDYTQMARREKSGLFNFSNIPTNLYYYFMYMPNPLIDSETGRLYFPYLVTTKMGMSFLVTSGLFLGVFLVKPTTKEQYYLWVTSTAILVSILAYYHNGTAQYGTRYMLDLLPLWFVLLLYSFQERKLQSYYWVLVCIYSLVNMYFYLSTENPYFQSAVLQNVY